MNCYILVGLPSVEANLKKDDLLKYGISDFFTKEILQICSEVSFNPCLISIDHYLSSSLWRNSLIKIEYSPVFFLFYKSWYSKGLKNVAHLMKNSTTFISYHEFEERFGSKSNYLGFQGHMSA